MRKLSILAIAFIVSIPLGLMAQDEGFYPYSYARLSYVNGAVFVQRTSDLGYEKGEVNLALVQGDKMGTEAGQVEVHFGRRNYLRLDDNTKVEFAVLPQEGDERIKIHITEGSAYLRVSYLATDKGIEVHTPDASFYVLEEGLYRFNVRLDRETEVFVREGSLEAAGEDGSVMVREKETLTASDGRISGEPEYFLSREDGFDDWNGSRDSQLAQRSERQYLPSAIEEYEEELDQNGQWVYERPYGNVWVPSVSDADWRPYLNGRWVWYPVIGWNWVSSESWGWSVYHYGRWHWRFGLGWYWIPQNHWGPAWVHWWSDNDYVGWCPLSWYNRPVVIVDNRFYDRHYDPFFPAHNRALSVVRRDQLQSHDISRRQIGAGERDRIDRVALKADQPRIRPAVDNARPQAVEARRALAVRSGSRSAVKSLPPADSVSSSRLRPGGLSQGVRTRDRGASVSDPNRNAVSRPAIKDPETGSRAIRSYPSQRVSGNGNDSGASESRRAGVAAPVRVRGQGKSSPGRPFTKAGFGLSQVRIQAGPAESQEERKRIQGRRRQERGDHQELPVERAVRIVGHELADLRRLAEPVFTVLRRPVSGALPFFKAGGRAASPASEQPVVLDLDLSLFLRPNELPLLLPPQLRPFLFGVVLEELLLVPVPRRLALALLFSAPELLFRPLHPLERFFRPQYQRTEVERLLFGTLLERGQAGRVFLRPLFFVRPVELFILPVLELFVQVRRRQKEGLTDSRLGFISFVPSLCPAHFFLYFCRPRWYKLILVRE
jgi:hypothetical protein